MAEVPCGIREAMTRWVLLGFFMVNLRLAGQDGSLHLVVLEGDGAINNVRSPRAKNPLCAWRTRTTRVSRGL